MKRDERRRKMEEEVTSSVMYLGKPFRAFKHDMVSFQGCPVIRSTNYLSEREQREWHKVTIRERRGRCYGIKLEGMFAFERNIKYRMNTIIKEEW